MIILGEIRQFPYEPNTLIWRPCNGMRIPISQNKALFSLIGNTFGGAFPSDFALPDYNGDINPSFKPYYYIAVAGHYVDENKLVDPMFASKAIGDARFNY